MLCLFVNAPYKWNVTKTNSCVHLNVTGKYISLYAVTACCSSPLSTFVVAVPNGCQDHKSVLPGGPGPSGRPSLCHTSVVGKSSLSALEWLSGSVQDVWQLLIHLSTIPAPTLCQHCWVIISETWLQKCQKLPNKYSLVCVSAYCPKHSTETALLLVCNDLLTASDSGSTSILTHLV